MLQRFNQKLSATFQGIGKFCLSPKGLFLIGLLTIACVVRPKLFEDLLVALIGIVTMVLMVVISLAGIAAMLAIFPGCLILPFWLAGRKSRKLEARIAQLEGKEKPPA